MGGRYLRAGIGSRQREIVAVVAAASLLSLNCGSSAPTAPAPVPPVPPPSNTASELREGTYLLMLSAGDSDGCTGWPGEDSLPVLRGARITVVRNGAGWIGSGTAGLHLRLQAQPGTVAMVEGMVQGGGNDWPVPGGSAALGFRIAEETSIDGNLISNGAIGTVHGLTTFFDVERGPRTCASSRWLLVPVA